MSKYRTVITQERIPEVGELSIDPGQLAQLDALCTAHRQVQTQIAPLEKTKKAVSDDIKMLAESLDLPKRLLGETWDLRRAERDTSKINEDRLKMRLLQLGIRFEVDCPPTVPIEGDGPSEITVDVCPHCNGTGKRVLESLDAVNCLVAEVTDRSVSVSWSVYGRDKSKEKDQNTTG